MHTNQLARMADASPYVRTGVDFTGIAIAITCTYATLVFIENIID